MARKLAALLGLVSLASACTRSASFLPLPTRPPAVEPSLPPSATQVIVLPTAFQTPTPSPATATATSEVAPSEAPTSTLTATQALPPSSTPFSTSTPPASQTPGGPRLDPQATWGTPDFVDSMEAGSLINWSGDGGKLPDTDLIRLELSAGQLLVTGKQLLFDTWWFSWPSVKNFYLEMSVRTDVCAGKDAYGLIIRGPARGVKPTHGYILAFSCDGATMLRRFDSTEPYTFVDLAGWTLSSLIRSGAAQTNVIGVKAEGGNLTIYADRYPVLQVSDSTYLEGRYAVFVRAAETEQFTYRVEEIAYWVIGD